jgi:hypothetical protein
MRSALQSFDWPGIVRLIHAELWIAGAAVALLVAGKFLKETQAARNLNYWALWAAYKFWEKRQTKNLGAVATELEKHLC